MKNAKSLVKLYIYIYTSVVFKNSSKHFSFSKNKRELIKEPI